MDFEDEGRLSDVFLLLWKRKMCEVPKDVIKMLWDYVLTPKYRLLQVRMPRGIFSPRIDERTTFISRHIPQVGYITVRKCKFKEPVYYKETRKIDTSYKYVMVVDSRAYLRTWLPQTDFMVCQRGLNFEVYVIPMKTLNEADLGRNKNYSAKIIKLGKNLRTRKIVKYVTEELSKLCPKSDNLELTEKFQKVLNFEENE